MENKTVMLDEEIYKHFPSVPLLKVKENEK